MPIWDALTAIPGHWLTDIPGADRNFRNLEAMVLLTGDCHVAPNISNVGKVDPLVDQQW